ncbi:MAG: hypothetical protein H6622_16420 [Halobacteriovoraceae bacterium]|nr:hypothetical protein [Halobacteriovoraceae bacterium]
MSININALTRPDTATSSFTLSTSKFTAELDLWNKISLEKSKVEDFDAEEDQNPEGEEQLELHKKVESHLEQEKQRRQKRMMAQKEQTKKEKKKEIQILLNIL